MRVARLVLCMCLLALSGPAWSIQPDEVLEDAALEARARSLSTELRCLVCQNQSIDDSDAPLARDLRILIRERLVAGDTDAQVLEFVVARYGEFVLLKPPFAPHTWILWLSTPVLLALGAGGIVAAQRRRSRMMKSAKPEPLSADEQTALDRILKE